MEKHIQHKHFSGENEKPILNDIVFGEIALNIAKGHEKIFFRNTNNEIIELNIRKKYNNFVIEVENYSSASYVKYFTLTTINNEFIYQGDVFSNETLIPCYINDYIKEGIFIKFYNSAGYCFISGEIKDENISSFSYTQSLPQGTNTSFRVYFNNSGNSLYNAYAKSLITNEVVKCNSEGLFEMNVIKGDTLFFGENENNLLYEYEVPSTGIPNNEIILK